MKTKQILGEDTTVLNSSATTVGVTIRGGHLGPVEFQVGTRRIAPMAVAPWAGEKLPRTTPPILQVLRGDFFCMPFGGNGTAVGTLKYPPHGETANARWKVESDSTEQVLHASLRLKAPGGRVDKFVRLVDGHAAVYQRHVVSGADGALPVGQHAMLKFPREGMARLSLSPFVHGQVFPGEFEQAAQGGYSCLEPGAIFTSLSNVPRSDGGKADLTTYPAREGYEDLVMMCSDASMPFAWTAATVASEGWVWIALKDPRVLRSTIFWMSNGGRHYAPWNGRHRGVIGVEEVTANFHHGAAESIRPNALTKQGIPTAVTFDKQIPTTVNYITAVGSIPKGFDIVRTVRALPKNRGIEVESASGKKARIALDLDFLNGSGRQHSS